MNGWRQDLRYSFRMLARRPLLTLAAILTMALGMGATTAIFSVVRGIVLRPLPYPEPTKIVEVQNRYEGEPLTIAQPEFLEYSRRNRTFAALAAFYSSGVNLVTDQDPRRLNAAVVSREIAQVLGLDLLAGRWFSSEEDQPGGASVVVLSHRIWQQFFAGVEMTGRDVLLDGRKFEVIGVLTAGTRMPQDHLAGTETDIWVPLKLDKETLGDWGMHGLRALGRLKQEVDLATARSDMNRVVAEIQQDFPGVVKDAIANPTFGVAVLPVKGQIVGDISRSLLILLAAVIFVLLIACSNVASLLLTRAEERRQEVALRSALGASRSRLARQVLAEAVILSVLGGAAGLLIASGGLNGLMRLDPGSIPRLDAVTLDSGVLLFALLLTLLTGIGFGLAPLAQWFRRDLQGALHLDGRRAAGSRRANRARSALIIVEVALAVVLVCGAGLLFKSLYRMTAVDPGFRTEGITAFDLDLPRSSYPDTASTDAFSAQLRTRLLGLPGVSAAGAVTALPLTGRRGDWNFYPEDWADKGQRSPRGDWQVIIPGYFQVMGIPLLQGRSFTASDDAEAPLVILFNKTLVEQYWPGENPVGKRVRMGGNDNNPWVTVVGVVGDVRHRALTSEPRPELYLPAAQAGRALSSSFSSQMTWVVRSQQQSTLETKTVRAAVAELDAALPVSNLRTIEEVRSRALARPRFAGFLIGSFAALAIVLGAIGIFGVLSYQTIQRHGEIGIRIALGADKVEVLRMVLGESMRITGAGLLAGLALAAGLTRLLSGLLYEVSPLDPAVFLAVSTLVMIVAAAASYFPARRAAATDPLRALQSE